MASYWVNEPFFSLNEFDRLFDEAFAQRTNQSAGSGNNNGQVQRHQHSGSQLAAGVLRPR